MIKLSGLSVEQTNKIIPAGTVLLGYVGSISHGTHIPEKEKDSIDDKDLMGICVLPKKQYLGLEFNPVLNGRDNRLNNEQQEVMYKEWDVVVYEIRKFFKLMLKQNPNVLGLLWLKSNLYIHTSSVGKMIIDNRDIFISKKAYHSFAGYANGQLHKMTHMAFKGYMGAKRKALVERFGYDTKNASHLIRLLTMCIEFLGDGELQVFRKDNDMLKSIKKGEWSLDKVVKESDRLFKLAQEAYVRSTLPEEPDYERAESLLLNIMEEYGY